MASACWTFCPLVDLVELLLLLVELSAYLLSLLNFYFYFYLLNYPPTCCFEVSVKNRATPFYLPAPTSSSGPQQPQQFLSLLEIQLCKYCCNQIAVTSVKQSIEAPGAEQLKCAYCHSEIECSITIFPRKTNITFSSFFLGGFHALTKIRQSLREKKPPLGKRAGTIEDVSQELDAVKVDLQVRSCGIKAF